MATTVTDIRSLVAAGAGDVVAWRRHLHRNPELSFHEVETSQFVVDRLTEIGGLEIARPTPTSVLARLSTGRPGRTLALRADIDALPIEEENEFDFVSTRPGLMHACGHDGHTAQLIAVARILSGLRDELSGEVRFVFQHAEELLPGGARDLVAAGVMDGVDAVVGCHLMAPLEPGKIAVLTGPAMAAADMFALTIVGKGGHGAFPHTAIDPIAVAAQVISSLQHIVSRNTNPLDSVVVSVTRIAGGTADNIIPMSVELGGTVRMFTKEHREQTRAAMERVIRGVTEAHGATYELDYTVGYDPVVNDAAIAAVVSDAVRETLGEDGLATMGPIMGGDDFSAYQAEAPGVYFMVGAGGPDAMPHHHPRFTVDEGAMTGAVEVFVRTALTLLART